MKLAKVDLGKVLAVGHEDDRLGLLIDRGDEVEFVQIPAPKAACEGLKQVAQLAANESGKLPPREAAIAMLPVASTMAAAIGYDRDRQILQVEFNSGSVYRYSDVDEDTWDELCESDSIGQFYNKEIKGYYDSQRLDYGAVTVKSYEIEED